MRVCVSYGLLPSIGVDVPAHRQSPLMRDSTVLCEVVCGAEPAEAPNRAGFALRCDDELCAHDGVSRIGGVDASVCDGRTRHARRGQLHSRYRRSSGGLPVTRLDLRPVAEEVVWTARRQSREGGGAGEGGPRRPEADLEADCASRESSESMYDLFFGVHPVAHLMWRAVAVVVRLRVIWVLTGNGWLLASSYELRGYGTTRSDARTFSTFQVAPVPASYLSSRTRLPLSSKYPSSSCFANSLGAFTRPALDTGVTP